jgi:hypothetical protein
MRDLEWIHVAQDRVQYRDFINNVTNIQVPKEQKISCICNCELSKKKKKKKKTCTM